MRRQQSPRGIGSVSLFSSGLWSFIISVLWLRRLATENVGEPREHPAQRIRNGHNEKHVMVESHQQPQESADKNKDLERMPIAQVEIFKAVKAPGTHHEKAHGNEQGKPQRRKLRPQDGISAY